MPSIGSHDGYSLIELLVVIIILGVIATVAVKSLTGVNDTVRIEETRQELSHLAWAIAGRPKLVSGGQRTDYGYVGDVGSLPVNLTALVQNPGSYSTWDGPYRGESERVGWKANAREVAAHRCRLGDGRDDPHASAAVRTRHHLQMEDNFNRLDGNDASMVEAYISSVGV